MICAIKSLNLAARGLFFEMYDLLDQTPNHRLDLEEKQIAEKLRVKFPHFSKSLKVLIRRRIILKTDEGLACPFVDRRKLREEIKETFATWARHDR